MSEWSTLSITRYAAIRAAMSAASPRNLDPAREHCVPSRVFAQRLL